MTATCHACATDITDSPVSCNGFCNAVFHHQCCSMPTSVIEEVGKIKQLFWLCRSCTKLMEDIRFRTSIRGAYDAGQENILSVHNEIVENIKKQIMGELKSEIRANFTALINSSSLTPKSTTRPSNVGSMRSRRLFQKPDATGRQQDLMCGTGSSLSPSLGTFTVQPTKEQFWLYLSRISRDETVDQIRELAKQRLATDDIEAVRLVAKGKDVNSLTFISFKIGVNPDLKAKALST